MTPDEPAASRGSRSSVVGVASVPPSFRPLLCFVEPAPSAETQPSTTLAAKDTDLFHRGSRSSAFFFPTGDAAVTPSSPFLRFVEPAPSAEIQPSTPSAATDTVLFPVESVLPAAVFRPTSCSWSRFLYATSNGQGTPLALKAWLRAARP